MSGKFVCDNEPYVEAPVEINTAFGIIKFTGIFTEEQYENYKEICKKAGWKHE